jgi:hypothetical protein
MRWASACFERPRSGRSLRSGFLIAVLLLVPLWTSAQEPAKQDSTKAANPAAVKPAAVKAPADDVESDQEIDVDLWHAVIGSTTITGLLVGNKIYLQPLDVFTFIKVRADAATDGTSLSGYYIDEARKYFINNVDRTILYQEKTTKLAPDEYIVRSTGGYLRADIFEKIFNLKCIFDFRGLSVELKSGEPLPAESESKYAASRKNIYGQTIEEKPDITFGLHRSLISLGVLDYQGAATATQGERFSQNPSQYSLFGGGQFLGGDMDATLQGESQQRIDWKAVPWQWRYSVQNSSVIRQLLIGRQDPLFTTMQLADSMVGFQISNVNTSYKTSFSNYTISDHTEPDWTVELYINDALVNYTKADQTGYYKFDIPLSYGTTNIKLKFYGPYGEVRTNVVQLRIPYTFLPPGHLEYTLTGGTAIAHPGIQNSVSQLDTKLGISTAMTIGGGLRYLQTPTMSGTADYTPYASGSFRVSGGVRLSGEYYQNSGYRGTMSVTGPIGLSLEAEYDKAVLAPGAADSTQQATSASDPFYVINQRKLTLSAPLPFQAGSLRMTAQDLPVNTDTGNLALTTETLLNFFGTSINLSANYNFLRDRYKLHVNGDGTGEAGLSLMLFSGIVARPSTSLDYTTRKFQLVQLGLTKSFGDWGNLSFTGTHSFSPASNSVQLSFRTSLPFAQVGVSGGGGSGQPATGSTTVQGSIGYDGGVGLYGGNRPEVRRGGVEVVPFIDQNDNGKWDPGEPLVPHFGLERAPGKVISSDSGILRIMDLEPYNHYFIKTSTADLDNISLLPKFTSFEITPPANGFARIDIPLASAGQIEGYVTSIKNGKPEGLGGARLKVRHWGGNGDTAEVKLTDDLLSYSNGEFYYMGITPGTYRIAIDPDQLRILHATCNPPFIDFVVKSKEDGDVINGLNFTFEHVTVNPVTPVSTLK